MSDSPRQSEPRETGWWLRLLIVGLAAIGLAVAVNYLAMPWLARELFSRTPTEELVSLEETREEVTREATIAIIAGMLGPPEPEAGIEEAEGNEPPGEKRETSESGDATSESGGSGSESREPRAASGDSPSETDESASESGDSVEPGEPRVFEIDRAELNRRIQNPGRVRDNVSVVSKRGPAGNQQGVRILEARGWFGQFGLRRGDVVTAINGNPVTTRRQAVSMLMGMRRETTFTLEVERHDNEFEIRYHLPHVDN